MIRTSEFTTRYPVQLIVVDKLQYAKICSSKTVLYRVEDLELGTQVHTQGMLLAEGNLTMSGNGVLLEAEKNMPAVVVRGNLIIKEINGVVVYGAMLVEGNVYISANARNINFLRGFFVKGSMSQTTKDGSTASNEGTLINMTGNTWSDGVDVMIDSTVTRTQDKWYHVATRHEKDLTNTIFVDGSKQSGETKKALGNSGVNEFYIGKQYHNYDGRYFKGMIDDVRIYNRKLSDGDIDKLSKRQSFTDEFTGLVGY